MLNSNIKDIAIGIKAIDRQTFQLPIDKTQSSYIFTATNTKKKLTLWHEQIRHLRIDVFQKYFSRLGVSYINDVFISSIVIPAN